MRKLFKGGNYSREETICGNTLDLEISKRFLSWNAEHNSSRRIPVGMNFWNEQEKFRKHCRVVVKLAYPRVYEGATSGCGHPNKDS